MHSGISSAIVLAAGQGKRMRSELPKVLHEVCGRPMLLHVLDAVAAVHAEHTVVVLGQGYEQVRPYLPGGVDIALQESPRGTGHAVLSSVEQVPPGAMLVVPGDTPLLTGEALRALEDAHFASGADATVLTMELDDPAGYGRVVRDDRDNVVRIVEHRDASPEELLIREVNTGIYVLPAPLVFEVLAGVGSDNDQGEIYLTDVVHLLRGRGACVAGARVSDTRVVLGVNSRLELAEAEAILGDRIKAAWMLSGVTMLDPASTRIESEVKLAPDCVIHPFTALYGRTTVGPGSDIGPSTTLVGCTVGAGCRLPHCCVANATLVDFTAPSPFTYIVDHETGAPAAARLQSIEDGTAEPAPFVAQLPGMNGNVETEDARAPGSEA